MCDDQWTPFLSEGLATLFGSFVILIRHQMKVLATASWDRALATQLWLNESLCLLE